MRLLPYIITFGLGIIFGYWIQGYPTLDNIKSIPSLGLIMISLIGIFRDLAKEKKERQLNHSKLLYDRNLKFRTEPFIFIGLADNIAPDLRISVNSSSSYNIDYKRYSNDVDAHLESGYYEEVWKHEKERDSLIETYNLKAIKFKEDLKEKIISELKCKVPSLSESNNSGKKSIKSFNPENISTNLCRIIYESYYPSIYFDQRFDQLFTIQQETTRWRIFIGQVLAESDNENEIREIKQTIKGVLDDALIGEGYNILKKYYEDIVNEQTLFVIGINEIIKNVENNNPVKGHCESCPKLSF